MPRISAGASSANAAVIVHGLVSSAYRTHPAATAPHTAVYPAKTPLAVTDATAITTAKPARPAAAATPSQGSRAAAGDRHHGVQAADDQRHDHRGAPPGTAAQA